MTQGVGNACPRICTGPPESGEPPNHLTLIVENNVPSARLGIERSLVPMKIVVMASTTCDRPKNRMIDSISGLVEPCSRGTSTQYSRRPAIRKITNASGTANSGSIPNSATTDRYERTKHKAVAMRQIDDAHDAEHEVET